MDGKRSARLPSHFDLPAGDCSIAKNAHALVVERMPFATQIRGLKDRELFFGKNRFVHWERRPTKAERRVIGNQQPV